MPISILGRCTSARLAPYRLTVRVTEGVYTPAGGSSELNTRAVSGAGEFIYGSTLFDVGVVYERFSSSGPDANRRYVSSGVRTKTGVLTLSLEGHYGRIAGEDEISSALGLQYDLARGLSTNLGLNYASARVILDGAKFVDLEETKAVFSLRYSF